MKTILASINICLLLNAVLPPRRAGALVDDRGITITSPADAAARRQALITFLWGQAGFPTGLPAAVEKNVSSPVDGLRNLERVDTLTIRMEADQTSYAHHFIPQHRNNRLVVLHHGHACSFNDTPGVTDAGAGMQRIIDELLFNGYSVLAVYMPHMVQFNGVSDCRTVSHDQMFTMSLTAGSPMKFFLEPVAVSLAYLRTHSVADDFPTYLDFNMVGFSGGGWTTTVYAAIDPTITLSFPVAGTIPLYLRSGGSVGDTEQRLDSFYQIAGYPDLYVLGSCGSDRKQVQILNRRDDCCFGQAQHSDASTGLTYDQAVRTYEAHVRTALYHLGAEGRFRLEIDEAAPNHTISWNTIVTIILAELDRDRTFIGAASGAHAFARGVNGNLWHDGPEGWEDTGLPMVGAPAALQNAVNSFDVFYRDPSNQLMHASTNGAGWRCRPIGGVVITDPSAVSWGAGRFDVVAFGRDYRLSHWWWTGSSSSSELLGSSMGRGPASLVSKGVNQLDVFFRGADRGLYRVGWNGGGWTEEAIGGMIVGAPSAVALPDGSLCAYARDQSGQLVQAAQVSGVWQWRSISELTGGQLISGSPSASLQSGTVQVYARTPAGSLSTFASAPGWTFTDHGGAITGSPCATSSGVFTRGANGGLWLFDGSTWFARGGAID